MFNDLFMSEYCKYELRFVSVFCSLTILLSERPKLYAVLAFLSATGLNQVKSITLFSYKLSYLMHFTILLCF